LSTVSDLFGEAWNLWSSVIVNTKLSWHNEHQLWH